jgi:ABC-2 type transport system ATP-binding protein
MKNVLRIENLTVKYDVKLALSNVSVEIAAGEFIGLLGSNGAGKSTLINAIIGLQKVSSGKISFNEKYLGNKKQPFCSLGFSPQTQVMDWYTTVWDNVILGLELAGKKQGEAKILCEQALEKVSLLKEKEKIIDTLSGGQQQRVQIARAIAHRPDIYLLDEPTTGLDAESSELLLKHLKEQTQLGKTVIISSHDIQLLEFFCDKILFLRDGKMEFYGEVGQFLEEEIIEFHMRFREKITEKQKEWLTNYTFQVGNIEAKTCVIQTTNQMTIIDVIQDLSPMFSIEDISVKKNHLRESYLNKVRRPRR